MEYLILFNRFNLDKNKFLQKINVKLIEDNENGSLVEGNLDLKEINNLQEVNSVFELVNNWKELDFRDLKKECLELVKEKKIKSYLIKTKFLDKIKISAKSVYKHINPYLKYDGFIVDEEDYDLLFYIEFRKEDKKVFYRLFYGYKKEIKVIKMDLNKFTVVLENPSLVMEVSDFLRLCWIFKLPLIIVTKDKNFNSTLNKAKEETKGIEYDKMKLSVMNELPKDYTLIGFSKHAAENEEGLIKLFKENKKFTLLFGDDKFGLSQEARDKLDYSFRLTPETKKPLRASHALSYVLGLYAGKNL